MSNPFSLVFGKIPTNYINRVTIEEEIYNSFNESPSSQQTYLITGIRGSGKTATLTSITKRFIDDDNWIICDLNPNKDLLEGMAAELYESAKVKSLFLKKEFSFSFKGISFSLEGETPITTSEVLIKKMLTRIKEKGKKVLLLIDEVISDDNMKIFASTFQSLIRFDYPVYLLMTGLYDNISKLQDEPSLTFLYRAEKIYLSSLNITAIMRSYQTIFKTSEENALKLANLTKGYAYAYQLLGYLLFKNNKVSADDDILNEYDLFLQEYIYDKLYSELSIVERQILLSFTEEIIPTKNLIENLKMKSSYLSVYRDRLIKKGLIQASGYGLLSLALPRFRIFLKNKSSIA